MIATVRAYQAKEAGGGNSTGLFQLKLSLICAVYFLVFSILAGCSTQRTETIYIPIDKQTMQREWLQAERKIRLEGRLNDSTGLETYAPAKLEPKTGSGKQEE